jgi:cell division protease FtsH
MAVGLGGRAAEELENKDITTGAENDLQEVTKLAREMVTRWGMSRRIGLMFLGGEQEVFLGRQVGLREKQMYSEQTAALIDEEVQHLISERYTYVQQLLAQHTEELERIATALLEQESLDEQQLQQLVRGSNNREASSENEAASGHLAAST